MELSSSSTPKTKKLNESKEAIEPKFSKRKKKNDHNCNDILTVPGSNMCHQCKSDRGAQVVRCLQCKSHRYCVPCITKWYPMLSEKDFELACPVCKGNCNCIRCLRLENSLPATRLKFVVIRNLDNISKTAKHMLKMIMPFMRQIHEEQLWEKTREAKIQGIISLSQLKVEEAIYQLNEHVYCDNCKTYIPDLHRSCTRCSYNLCVTCCQEVCDGCLHGVQEKEIKQIENPGEEFLRGAGNADETKCEDRVNSTYEWKLDENENILCPLKDMGGCGNGILTLKHILNEDHISSLFWRANSLFEQHNLRDLPESSLQWCTCPNSCDSGGNLRRATLRENSNDNYLYSPTAVNIKDDDLKHFQSHFFNGEPVIVNNVLETACGLSWEPSVIRRAFGQNKDKKNPPLKNVVAINCLDWVEVDTKLSHFFKGYQEGQIGEDGCPQILQLKDWPPSTLFNYLVPRHSWEFISSLPFKEYTHPYSGNLNLAVMPSDGVLKPDLRPKMHISYGVAPELERGDSVKNLQYNMCDTVVHPIHDQNFYLSGEHKRRLKAEYGIEPWSFVQQLGDAVFVPAGCPYQVRDIKSCMKVSVGFVSPENVHQCIRLENEIRELPQHHRAKKDILEVKNLIINAIERAVDELEELNPQPILYSENSFQLSKSPNLLSEDSHGGQSFGIDTESVTFTIDKGVEDFGQGPSAREEEAPTENGRKKETHNHNSFTIASEKQLEIVPHTSDWVQSTQAPCTVRASPNISHRTPISLPVDTVGYFNQLADMLQGDKFDQILPPQIQLDEQTVFEYEQVLKKGMYGELWELGKDFRYQEFNEVLTALLSCRRIPSNLLQGFLSLRRDLPGLASRAFELEKEVTRGMLQRDNRSTVKQLKTYMEKYRNCVDNLVLLEQEKTFNLSEIDRLSSEVQNLQSRNQVIDSEIVKFTTEADTMGKACARLSHTIANLDGVDAVDDESTLQQSIDNLHKLENEWRKRVDGLNF
ncbi:hypothetical protein AG4045_028450 [Apium graveolens]|uniref:JmjC domain-containing protein n=1 Tax=Apium graveolens TaxID=4045 RepID=A0A6L5B728_APIGR|nr:hypothetical protein AG4045_028450 [Apium graveolens]